MKLLRLVLLAILGAATTSFAWRSRAYSGPLEVSYWYWHCPFRISRSDAATLRQMGVTRLFVRAGTFSTTGLKADRFTNETPGITPRDGMPASIPGGLKARDGSRAVHLVLPQVWESRAEQEIVLVFNAHTDFLRDFGKLANGDLTAGMKSGIQVEIERARRAGMRVTGVQLDIDCPTRLLPKYAEVVRGLRRPPGPLKGESGDAPPGPLKGESGDAPPGPLKGESGDAGGSSPGVGGTASLSFSITALPTWLASDGFVEVAGAVDFVVPQFYEGRIARDVREFAPISSAGALERGLERMERLGTPFYAGLPAYGHALAYSGEGKLLGGYSDMDAAQALSHPALRLVDWFPATAGGRRAAVGDYIGEDILKFTPVDMRPENPDGPDHGMGRKPYYLIYDVPSPAMLSRNLSVLRGCRPSNCRGVILYRFPAAGDSMALPLAASADVLGKRIPAARPAVEVDRMNPAWDLIDTGSAASKDSGNEFRLVVSNAGTCGTAVAADALEVTIRVDGGGIASVDAGGFDGVESLLIEPGGEKQIPHFVRNDDSSRVESGSEKQVPHFVRNDGLGVYSSSTKGVDYARSSLRRANALRFRKSFLGAGERALIGPISLKRSRKSVFVEWKVLQPGGFEWTNGHTEVVLK